MARSARSSAIKKNNAVLKKRVFGPVESARNDRMSAKLLELAKAPKEKMEVEQTSELGRRHTRQSDMEDHMTNNASASEKDTTKEEKAGATGDIDMDAADKPRRSKREVQRRQIAQAARFERKSNKKPRNQVSFPSNSRKNKSGKGSGRK